MKRLAITILVSVLLQGCFGSGLPKEVEEVVLSNYGPRGKTSPLDVAQMGRYYFNTKILASSQAEVPNGLKELFIDGYCINISTDEQTIRYRDDEQKPLTPRKFSVMYWVKHSGDIMSADPRPDWKNIGCNIEFIPR